MKIDEIDAIPRCRILRNAIQSMPKSQLKGRPLWGVVRDLCGCGSSMAVEICLEIGWNPDADAAEKF